MTREEAINVLENGSWWDELNQDASDADINTLNDALDMAISALREQEERENPTPLTLDELREMAKWCEGVYIAHIDRTPVFRDRRYCAAVLDISPTFGSTTLHVHAIYGDRLTLWEDDYGITWLAYRHKPREARNG